MISRFDDLGFAAAVRERMGSATVRSAAANAGVPASILFRASHTLPINISNFLTLCDWLGVEASSFYLRSPASHETSTGTQKQRDAEARSA